MAKTAVNRIYLWAAGLIVASLKALGDGFQTSDLGKIVPNLMDAPSVFTKENIDAAAEEIGQEWTAEDAALLDREIRELLDLSAYSENLIAKIQTAIIANGNVYIAYKQENPDVNPGDGRG